MFPSLCQRVRIAIKHRVNSCRTCVVASYILNMSKISNSGEYGKFVRVLYMLLEILFFEYRESREKDFKG